MEYTYKEASREELEAQWAKNIAANASDARWADWKQYVIADNESGICKTFVVMYGESPAAATPAAAIPAAATPVGEGTLLFSPKCGAINGRRDLADGERVTNINALRIEKAHEGKGHISKLVKLMEQYARCAGYTAITIGVEARSARNLAIYLHWGYTKLVRAETEDGELVLYYEKTL